MTFSPQRPRETTAAERPDLPPLYYHDHFLEMLAFVVKVYADFLNDTERVFVSRFLDLSESAQCLFIRMVNRKAEIFSASTLIYDEIDGIGDAINELKKAHFAKDVGPDDYVACLLSLPKNELVAIAREENLAGVRLSWDKRRLASQIATSILFENIFMDKTPFIRANNLNHVSYLLYLYFGKTRRNLTSFTLRDLGLLRVRDDTEFSARFADEEEARHSYFYLDVMKRLRSGDIAEMQSTRLIAGSWPLPRSRFAQAKRDEALQMLGQYFERKKMLTEAIEAFELGQSSECRERAVRLSYATGDKTKACFLLECIIADPASDDEYIFASDFYARKFQKQKIGLHTQLLRNASEVFVDDVYRGSAELAMINHFEREGWSTSHTENGLWVALFALFFWKELFETAVNRVSPFDHYPVTLRQNNFADLFRNDIGAIVTRLQAGEGVSMITASLQRNKGRSNALFYWSDELAEFIKSMVSAMPSRPLASIIEKMALNFENMSDGFPDLTLVRGDQIKFVEVKADGDQIQRHQLTRIRQLTEAGFDVEICRVGYKIDPSQSFVVVDVETTGGRAEFERVTEIGAVKVIDGKIVDEWESLINPEKRIPAFITGITGITNDMVNAAPVFAEVAGGFRDFMQGSIFAAHNVNFDYGFLLAEFQRLEQRFRYPKICTCASMRKYFPGHSSYSLASMSREYGIGLKDHHRALCDARAAAELLILINQRRGELQVAA